MSLDKEAVRNWNPRQVLNGIYQVTKDNPLHFADYAYALRHGSGTVAELLVMLGRSNVKKLQSGKVSRLRDAAAEDMPLLIVTDEHWNITPSGVQRYSRSWYRQSITPPKAT